MSFYSDIQAIADSTIRSLGFTTAEDASVITLTHLPGGVVDSGVTITPIVTEEVRLDGRVIEWRTKTTISPLDPALTSPPKPGDLLTVGPHQYRIIPGERGVVTDAGELVYRLILKGK